MTDVLLEARNIGKKFGGVQALKDVSLTIRRGEIYGLIGPNGAGKTTLFNVFTGLYPRDGGEVLFTGQPLALESPHTVAAAGIARTFQNIRLFGNMTARENVMVGRHVRTRAGVFGAILRTLPSARRKPPSAAVPTSCCITLASPTAPTTWRAIFLTATSAGSKSPGHSPPSRNCWHSTNRPPA
jgi:ABC-type branched-subunit amino acid transport system ATPase component